MTNRKTIRVLTILIVILAAAATITGILATGSDGHYEYTSVRGEVITLHGSGIYRHMSADVAIQGIAQDYITLFAALPALVLAMILALRGSIRAQFFSAGITFYLFVTYLFYTAMAMYHELFLIYVALMGLSFFSLALQLLSLHARQPKSHFTGNPPVRLAGVFLVINASLIFLLWLSVILPPLLDGSLYPNEVDHYTTLIVQGFDLGLMLPLSAVSGILLFQRKPLGFLLGLVYLVFLLFLMAALIAKLVAMGLYGAPIFPAICIIPVIWVMTGFSLFKLVRKISPPSCHTSSGTA